MTARRKACRHRGHVLDSYGPDYKLIWMWCTECGSLFRSQWDGGWLRPGRGYEASLRRALRRKQRKEKE